MRYDSHQYQYTYIKWVEIWIKGLDLMKQNIATKFLSYCESNFKIISIDFSKRKRLNKMTFDIYCISRQVKMFSKGLKKLSKNGLFMQYLNVIWNNKLLFFQYLSSIKSLFIHKSNEKIVKNYSLKSGSKFIANLKRGFDCAINLFVELN